MRSNYLRYGVVVALAFSVSTPAHAQFGKLGDAIKKKAKEVGVQATAKEEPKKDDAAPAVSPSQLTITADVLDRLTKGLTTESTMRGAYVKREACSSVALQSPEYIQLLTSQSEEMSKIPESATDAQKMAAMTKIGEDLKKKQDVYLVRKCGPEVAESDGSQMEAAGAEASGFTAQQYSLLKERTTAYCEAVARGSDTPSNSRMVFTADEMATIKPRCSALLQTLKKNT